MSADQSNESQVKRRPAWRRVAGLVRRGINRAATVVDPFVHSSRNGLLPPAHLRIYYYRTWDPGAFVAPGSRRESSWSAGACDPSTGYSMSDPESAISRWR